MYTKPLIEEKSKPVNLVSMKGQPLIYELLFYCGGIFFSHEFDFHHLRVSQTLCTTGIILCCFFFFMLFRYRESDIVRHRESGIGNLYKKNSALWWGMAWFLGLSIFVCGLISSAQENPKLLEKDPSHLLSCIHEERIPCKIIGEICLPKKYLSNDRERIDLETEGIQFNPNSPVLPVKGKVALTLYSTRLDINYGDRIEVTTKLQRPTGYRNERTFNYRTFLFHQGIYATGSVSREEQVKVVSRENRGKGLKGMIFRLRDKAGELADVTLASNGAASFFFKAIILGDRDSMPDDVEQVFRHTGTMHLIGVSGLHLGFLLFFCIGLIYLTKKIFPIAWFNALSRISPCSRFLTLFSIFPLCFYTLLTEMRLSTLRALIMICLFLIAFFFDRGKGLYATLAWAAMILLIWKPLSLFHIDFQFTFLAPFGIIYYLRHPVQIFKQRPLLKKGADIFFISMVAVIITAPLCILYFHSISWGGILFTPLAIPFFLFSIPIGLIATVLLPVSLPLSRLLMLIAGSGLNILFHSLRLGTKIPFIFNPFPSPPLFALFLFYSSLFFIACFFSRRDFRKWMHPYVLIPLLCIAWLWSGYIFFPMELSKEEMAVTFLDVGKGDAALIRLPNKQNIMIDGGGAYDQSFAIGEKILTPYLWSRGVRDIRAILISHPHPDHIYGLFSLLRNFSIGEVWVVRPTLNDKRYRELKALMEKHKVRERIIDQGERIMISPDTEIICLHPPQGEEIPSPKGQNSLENNHSMVVKVSKNAFSILFTGDIEKEAEETMLQSQHGALASTILKASHHGSKYSSTLPFITAVKPEATIISTRQSSWYPLPDPDTLKRLEKLPTKIYRTDLDGAVTLYTEGRIYRITTWMDDQNILPILRWLQGG